MRSILSAGYLNDRHPALQPDCAFHLFLRLIALLLVSVLGFGPAGAFAADSAASNWQWEKTQTPEALVINGIWWEYFKLGPALDGIGFRQQRDFTDLTQYSVIVLVNASPNRIPSGGFEVGRAHV